MKQFYKIIAAMLSVILTITNIGVIPVAAENETAPVSTETETKSFLYNNDFSEADILSTGYPEGSNLQSIVAGDATTAGTVTREEAGYLKFAATGKQEFSFTINTKNIDTSTPLWIEMDVARDSDTTNVKPFGQIHIKGIDSSETSTILLKTNSANIYKANGTDKVTGAIPTLDDWVTISLKLDLDAKTCTRYLDGEELDSVSFESTDLEKVQICIPASSSNPGRALYFDNLSVYTDEAKIGPEEVTVRGISRYDFENGNFPGDTEVHSGIVVDQVEEKDAAGTTTNTYMTLTTANDSATYWRLRDINYNSTQIDTAKPLWVAMDVAVGEEIPNQVVLRIRDENNKNTKYFLTYSDGTVKTVDEAVCGTLSTNKWVRLACKFDFSGETDTYTAYVVENGKLIQYGDTQTYTGTPNFKWLEMYFVGVEGNADAVLKIDNIAIYQNAEYVDIANVIVETEDDESGSLDTETPTTAPDVEIIHPDLDDFQSGIAVMAGQSPAYVNGQAVSVDASDSTVTAELNGENDVLVPSSFIESNLGVTPSEDAKDSETGMYSLRAAAEGLGKTVTWDSRGLMVITESGVTTNEKLVSLLVGYLEKNVEANNYAVSPQFTQTIIDEAVALEPAGWILSDGANYDPAENCANALYYLTLATYLDKEAAATDGTLCKDAALKLLRYFIAGGNEPNASAGQWWGHGIFSSALVLAKNTPAIYDELNGEEKERMDWLMKALAVAGNWMFNDDNNYSAGLDFGANGHKSWNPNITNPYLACLVSAALYFGAEELDQIFLTFEYDDYIAKFTEFEFANILSVWTSVDLDGVSIGHYMENGGSIRYNSIPGINSAKPGESAGSGVGVRVAFKYKDMDLNNLVGIFSEMVDWTYSFVVMNSYNTNTNYERCYIISGLESPYTGQMGMMREFAASSGRSRVGYCWDSYEILSSVYANLKLLGNSDSSASAVWDSSTSAMREIDNRIYVGNEDLIFKMEQGYHGYSNGTAYDEYEYKFESRGNRFVKDIWRNFHCMLNEEVTTLKKPFSFEDTYAAAPKDNITEPPEGVWSAIDVSATNQYFTDECWYSIGENLQNGTIEFDLVMEDDIDPTAFDSCVIIGQKKDNITYKHASMIVQLKSGSFRVRNGSMYVQAGVFNTNYRFHIKVTFDVPTKKYTMEVQPTYPTVEDVFVVADADFRNKEIEYVDSLCLVKSKASDSYWVENFKIVGKETEVTPTPIPEQEEVKILAEGTDGSYTLGTNGTAKIHCTGEMDELVSVELDGGVVDVSNYTVTEGSTIVTFKTQYLEALSVGIHTVTLNYTADRSADTTLTIIAANNVDADNDTDGEQENEPDNESADNSEDAVSESTETVVSVSSTATGDNSNMAFFSVVAFASLATVAIFIMKFKRKEE